MRHTVAAQSNFVHAIIAAHTIMEPQVNFRRITSALAAVEQKEARHVAIQREDSASCRIESNEATRARAPAASEVLLDVKSHARRL